MRVLAAFDKFKDSISAAAAAHGFARALARVRPAWTIDPCPLSDGGEGFADILTRAAGGVTVPVPATGPRGRPLQASFGRVPLERIPAAARSYLGLPGDPSEFVAVVEMAAASGLALLPAGERNPLDTSSYGTGELLRAAAAARPAALLLGVGGSATNDLGLGALLALGLEVRDPTGRGLGAVTPRNWPHVRALAGNPGGGLPPLFIACDVENPLLGPRGALAVYGPQKGLQPADYESFEAECGRLAALLCRHFGQDEALVRRPGAGAAGGIAFGLMAAAGARLLPGMKLLDTWLDLDRRIAAADIVVTGEGRFDSTSLTGKGPGDVARRARDLGKEVHVFAGQVRLPENIPGLRTHAITPPGVPLAVALAAAEQFLQEAVAATWPGA